MRIRHVAAITFASLLLVGCFSDSSSSGTAGIRPTNTLSGNNAPPALPSGVGVFFARFEAVNVVGGSSGILPYPTDLYFSGTTDGTLNIPNLTVNAAHLASLNALDGYSTIAAANVRFSRPILASSISGTTVRMIEVDVSNTTKATVGVRRVLVYGTDYTARVAAAVDAGGATLEIVPLLPLTPSTGATNVGYLIVLTNGLLDTSNNVATPDADYVTIKNALPSCASITNASLNGICQLTGAHLAIAGAVGVPSASVIVSFSFSTQATRDTLNIAAQMVQPTAIVAPSTGLTLNQLNPAFPANATVHAGTLSVPYYLSTTAPVSGSWRGNPATLVPGATPTTFLTRFNPVPVVQATLDIPLLVTVPTAPACTKPLAGWPVVIFQHGLRSDRSTATAIAGTYASQCFAVAAIDAPMHGITSTTNPLYQASRERTFNLDLLNNATNALVPDGVIDGSGTWFLNLSSGVTTRDNFRQGALDLVQLARSLPGLDLDGVAGGDIDPARIHYSGISLGGILGTVASALPGAGFASAYVNVPGGALALMVPTSPTFSALFNPSLAATNPMLVPGMTLYDAFWRDLQAVADSADPINYVAAAVAARPLLLTQVNGDIVIPNSATQRLVTAGGFIKAQATGAHAVGPGNGRWVQFTTGVHSSLLDPTASAAAWSEMQGHALTFVVAGGTGFQINNSGILAP